MADASAGRDHRAVVSDFSCSESAYEHSQVLTEGKHHLEFTFGGDSAFANNQALIPDATLIIVKDSNSFPDTFTFSNTGFTAFNPNPLLNQRYKCAI